MRWADMDLQGHVNNVVYLDYLQEARVDLLRTHGPDANPIRPAAGPAEGVIVVSHEVSYLAPLVYRFQPVQVEVWVSEVRGASFRLAYELSSKVGGQRVVHLRAASLLAPFDFATDRPRRLTAQEREGLMPFLEPEDPRPGPERWVPVEESRLGHYPVQVRFSDVDVYGHVNNVTYVEYFMEARILLTARLWRDVPAGTPEPVFVVAQADVSYVRPMTFRAEPYDCWTRVTHVGTTSVLLESEIRDGATTCARAAVTLVFIDPATGRPAPPPPAYRDALEQAMG